MQGRRDLVVSGSLTGVARREDGGELKDATGRSADKDKSLGLMGEPPPMTTGGRCRGGGVSVSVVAASRGAAVAAPSRPRRHWEGGPS